jgi:hypothetical protein
MSVGKQIGSTGTNIGSIGQTLVGQINKGFNYFSDESKMKRDLKQQRIDKWKAKKAGGSATSGNPAMAESEAKNPTPGPQGGPQRGSQFGGAKPKPQKPEWNDVRDAFNGGHITVEEAEGLLGRKAKYPKAKNVKSETVNSDSSSPSSSSSWGNTSSKAIGAPQKAIGASTSNKGSQFIAVDSKGGASPMVNTPKGPAHDLDR